MALSIRSANFFGVSNSYENGLVDTKKRPQNRWKLETQARKEPKTSCFGEFEPTFLSFFFITDLVGARYLASYVAAFQDG